MVASAIRYGSTNQHVIELKVTTQPYGTLSVPDAAVVVRFVRCYVRTPYALLSSYAVCIAMALRGMRCAGSTLPAVRIRSSTLYINKGTQ
eukprot:3528510-Rhodomonas_salina.2